jgi:uncharacterized membrane protein
VKAADRCDYQHEERQETMTTSTLEVFVAAFASEEQAGAALTDFKAADREGSIELIDAAAIVHGADGKVRFEETADPSGKKWAKRGASIPDEELRRIGESIPKGGSAIIAVAEDRMIARLQRGIEGYEKISRHALNADASAQLIAEIEAEPSSGGGNE